MTYHETIHTLSLDFWAATLPRLFQTFTTEAPALGWAELTQRLERLHPQLLAQLSDAQAAQLAQLGEELEQATQVGMAYAACQGMVLVSADSPADASQLLEHRLFRLDANCPAAYRQAVLAKEALENSLLEGLAPELLPLAEELLAYADDAHRLACYAAAYLGFCLFAQPLAQEQPKLLPGLQQRGRTLCSQLGLPYLNTFK